jgi:uncharacterized protein
MKKSTFTLCFLFVFPAFFACQKLNALSESNDMKLAGIPFKLEIINDPVECKVIDHAVVELSAKGKTNLFNNPNGKYYVQDAPMLVFEPDSDFVMSAKVTGDLKEIYDVMALVVYQDKDLWAKLCFENSVEKTPTIVSVVTRKLSDDCNSMYVNNDFAYLSIMRKNNEFSFFYSSDEENWKMIRHFNLDITNQIKVGFAVHGSRGNGFSAKFSDIKFLPRSLDVMRKL